MNILVLNWRDKLHPEAGGAEVHFTEIFRRLVARGHKVILLTTRFPGSSPQDSLDGITVYRAGHTYTFNWEAPFLIRSIMRKQRIDCIIDDVNKIPFFSPRWFSRVPTGVFFHHLFGKTVYELAPWPMASYVYLLENLSYWGYRKVPCCTVSKSTADELVSCGFARQNITIVENSVDTDQFTPRVPVHKEMDLLLYTGRLKRYKNITMIFEALLILGGEHGRRMRLAIAGTGDDEAHLRARASELGVAQQVEFRGRVTEEEKIELYRSAALFVNPSLKEGWGITNIEANACGTAVVANDAPGLRDSVLHGKTGFLCKEKDPSSMAAHIATLLDNPRQREQFEEQGRTWALEFSWDKSAGKVEQWLNKVVSVKQQ